MATKKVLVEINVEQKGAALDKTTKEVKKLTDVEKERLRIKKERQKTDAKIEVVNEKATKDLAKQKKVLNELTNSEKIAEQTKKKAIASEAKLEKERKASIKATLRQADAEYAAKKALDRQRQAALKASDAQEKLSKTTEVTNSKLDEMKTTAGLSGAIVTEFGRTISDLPYGFRGIGNNLSQLATLFGLFAINVQKSGRTMAQGLGEIVSIFKGPLGLITLVQIFVALLESGKLEQAWDWAVSGSSSLSKLRKELKNVTDEFGGLISELDVYTGVLQDSTRSVKEKEDAYKKIIEKFPELESSIKRVGDEFVVSANAVEDMKDRLEELALSSAALNRLSELSSEKLEGELKDRIKINESIRDSNKLKKDSFQSVSDEDLKKIKEYSDIINNDTDSEGFVITQQQREEAISNLQKVYKKSLETEKARLDSAKPEKKRTLEQIHDTQRNTRELKHYIESLEEVSDSKKDLLTTQGKFNKENQTEVDILKSYIKVDDREKTTSKDPLERRVSRFKETRLSLQSELQKSENDLKKTAFRTNKEIIQDEGESSKDVIKIKTDEFKKRERLRLKNFIAQKEIDKKRKGITQAEKDRIDKSIEEAEVVSARTIELADKEANGVIDSITKVTDARILNRQRLDEVNQRKRDDSVQEGELGLIANLMSEGMQKILAEEELAQIRYDNKVARANEDLALDTLTEDQRRDLETQKSLWSQEKAQEDLDFDVAMIEERYRVQQEYIGFIGQTSGILQAIGNKNKEWQKAQLILEKGTAIAGVVTEAAKSIGVQTAAASTANQLIAAKYAAIPAGSIKAALEIKANTALYRKGVTKTKVGAGLSIAAITAGAVSGLNSISNSGGSSSGGGGSTTVQPPDFNIVGSTGVNQLADAIGSTEKQPVKAFVVASEVTTQQALDRNNRSNAEL